MISVNHKFVFIHINKTAGTSIENALKVYGHKKISNPSTDIKFQHTQHFNHEEYKLHLGEEYKNHYKFTVVRNPWDRVVSYYHSGAITNNLSFGDWVVDRYKNNNFLDHLRMYQPCTAWFDLNDVDYILKFENLSEDFEKICEILNLECELGFHNVNKNRNKYQDYYDDDTRIIIENFFKSDINKFNYKF